MTTDRVGSETTAYLKRRIILIKNTLTELEVKMEECSSLKQIQETLKKEL